jgi:hypothetical protein
MLQIPELHGPVLRVPWHTPQRDGKRKTKSTKPHTSPGYIAKELGRIQSSIALPIP